jgi:hypothetical protein
MLAARRVSSTRPTLPTTDQSSEQLSYRSPRDRVVPVRRNLGERFQHEGAVAKTRVWHHEVTFIHDEVAVQDQVEIESARRTRVRALTAELSFDINQGVEEVAGRQRRVAGGGGVQKPRLIADTNGIGFVKSGYADLLEILPEGGESFPQQTLAVTQVAAESDCGGNCDQVLLTGGLKASGYQLPTTNHQPPTTNHQPPTRLGYAVCAACLSACLRPLNPSSNSV